jgi:cysteine desulfurase/selenocysteine lyase
MTIYLDNAATTFPKPDSVYTAVMYAMREVGASAGRGGYRKSLEAARLIFRARETVAKLFSIADSSRIIFTHSATESLNLALHGILLAGDHVITTSMEHNSMLRPMFALRKNGVEITIVPTSAEGIVDPDDIRSALRPNTRMIAVGHVSNVCGALQPVDAIAAIAREAGALFLMDAAQSAGVIPIDVVGSGIDLLAAPGHKGLFGPQGTGFLYVAPGVALKPIMQGGTGSHSSSEEQPDSVPDGFESGTQNLSGISGLQAGVDFILETGLAAISSRERVLIERVEQRLSASSKVRLVGPSDPAKRVGVLSMIFSGVDPSELAHILDHDFDIAVRAGLHCAPYAHRTLGTYPEGTLRISPGYFSTTADVDLFCDAVEQSL